MEDLNVERGQVGRLLGLTFCEGCKKETEHKHMIDSPYGLEGAYMSGSERYECKECGHAIFHGDKAKNGALYGHLEFRYEEDH